MSDPDPTSLTRVAEYRRTIDASLERVWENVLDWEHLPWVHGSSFLDISVEDSGNWGWRSQLGLRAGEERQEVRIELLTEQDSGRYVTRTLEGPGATSEIWTHVAVRDADRTDIRVEFWIPGVAPEAVDAVGKAYLELYSRLWDEDEQMMQEREAALASRREKGPPKSERILVGSLETVRSKMPQVVEFDGQRVWVFEGDSGWVAWSSQCPHRLGPLEQGTVEAGVATCPWHGYRFDLSSGEACDGLPLRLFPAARVVAESGSVWLESIQGR